MQVKSVHFVQGSFRKADMHLELARGKKNNNMLNGIENPRAVFPPNPRGGVGWWWGSCDLFLCYCFQI